MGVVGGEGWDGGRGMVWLSRMPLCRGMGALRCALEISSFGVFGVIAGEELHAYMSGNI